MAHIHLINNQKTGPAKSSFKLHNHRMRLKDDEEILKGLTSSDKGENHIHNFKGFKTGKPKNLRV